MSFKVGPATYESKALYPARSLSTLEIILEPFVHRGHGDSSNENGRISMRELVV